MGDRVVLYFKVNTKSTNLCGTFLPKPFEGKPWVVASAQRDDGIGGEVTTIAGKNYVVLKATMLHAHAHHDAIAGAITLVQMKKILREEGFNLNYEGTETTVILSW